MTNARTANARTANAKTKTPVKTALSYQSGFGNEFASEAVEGYFRAGRILLKKWRMGCTRNN